MAQMGRHNFPQNEAIASASDPKWGVEVFSRGFFAMAFLMVSQAAFAEQEGKQTSRSTPKISTATLLPTTSPTISPDFSLKMPEPVSTRILELNLNLDFDSIGCLVGEQNCLRDEAPIDMGFTTSISKNSKKGLDLELVPTASMRFDDEGRSAVVGAVVRIGEDLRSKDVSSNTWYVFAGADAEALSYSPDSATALTRGEFGLSDRIIIGDAQAGVGYRIGSADVSLGYFRREVSTINDSPGSEGFSKREDAAALSFTWKR